MDLALNYKQWLICHKTRPNLYMLSRRFTYQLSENGAIKPHLIIKHNSTNQLTSSDVRKILTDDTIIIYKNTIIKNDYKS